MTTPARRTAAGPLKALMTLGVVGEEPDARLLDVYRSGRPGADDAFRMLVERHGPTVHAVCRGVVPDPTEADDAFQAVFLVLIRRAGAIRRAESLGPWLHGVALRVARKARRRALARSARLRLVAPEALADAAPAPADRSDLIHAEIDRLPDRDRRPLVLCALEGLSYEQAARALGVSESTLRGRLHRARKRLEARLKAEGVDAPRSLIPPAPPAALLEAAIARASAASPVPASISSLAKGAMLAMSLSSWKPAVFSSLATLGIAGSVVMARQEAVKPTPESQGPQARFELKSLPPEEKERLAGAMKGGISPEEAAARKREILEALEEPLDFEIPADATLEWLLRAVRVRTARGEAAGVPIYVAPEGLEQAHVTLTTPLPRLYVNPLTVGGRLKAVLEGLGLDYIVADGFVSIDSRDRTMQRRIEAVETRLDALIEKLQSAPIFFDEPRTIRKR